jgi:mRNA interferase MazF
VEQSSDFDCLAAVPTGSKLTGYIMVEQIKSIDYGSRKAAFIAKAPRSVVDEVLGILDACVYE